MKKGLLLYKECDYEINREFAARFLDNCGKFGLEIDLVIERNLRYGIQDGGFYALYEGEKISGGSYDFAVNRTRNAYISTVLENLNIRVFNSSAVTALCNDKNLAYLNAAKLGINCLDTYIYFVEEVNSTHFNYPVIVKQPFGHGGNNVYLCNNNEEVSAALLNIKGMYITVQQKLECSAVSDIRVFVMGNKVIGAVQRRANEGFKANYSKGGSISLYVIDKKLQDLVQKLLKNGYYDFAGFDFLYNGDYYFNEIEDVVGSRSLCMLKNIDTSELYLDYISGQLNK